MKEPIDPKIISEMTDTLRHRGPDGKGIYLSEDAHVSLGHRRLSFLDLSEAGNQPMCSNDKCSVISFNGEIYNYLELKEELKTNYSFHTTTDTEIILAGYQRWGINVINKLKGMFAFALWDQKQKKIFIVRDRFGIKPLYYFISKTEFIFASELKAILASGKIDRQIDYSAFCDYFVYRYIPSPKTIWKNIQKVRPACYIQVDLSDLSYSETEYWVPKFSNNKISKEDLVAEIDELILNSVRQHLRADVPIGSFLSGGYDSSALLYYMKRLGYIPDTFSIGFKNWESSEHQYAKIVAEYLCAENEAMIADRNELQLMDVMPLVYDEPLADLSIVPTFMVSQLASDRVKSVMSGEGADEIFGGYTWQKEFYRLNKKHGLAEKIKLFFRPFDAVDYYAQSMATGSFGMEDIKSLLPPHLHQYIPSDLYWFYRTNFKAGLSPLKSIQYLDMKCFLGEMVLTKMDRASMFHSLEVRVPFLDHELYEKIFSLAENSYFEPSVTKMPLYEILKGSLPSQILARPKQGFVGPVGFYSNINWYVSRLENSVLVEAEIVQRGYIDKKIVDKDYESLWKIVIMEGWFSSWINKCN